MIGKYTIDLPESVKSVHGLLIFTIKSFSISCMHNWVNANYWKVLSNCLESMKSMFATWEYKTGWVLLTQFPLFSCQLLTNVKDMDKPKKRWRAVYEIYCSYCQGSILERLAKTSQLDWLDTSRWQGKVISTFWQHWLMNHTIDWDYAQCLTYSTNYF